LRLCYHETQKTRGAAVRAARIEHRTCPQTGECGHWRRWTRGDARGREGTRGEEHVREDGPTVPNMRGYDTRDRAPGGTPIWPGAGARAQPPQRSSAWDGRTVLLGVSLGANVLLLGLLCPLLLARAGVFSPRGPAAQSAAGASVPSVTRSSPSPTPATGWLRVTPTSVQLGCAEGQQTQVVVLANTGPQRVRWQVEFDVPTEQAGVAVSPSDGNLAAGARLTLQIQLHNQSQDASQQGVLRFAPLAAAAGPGPILNYTSMSCQ